MTSVRRTGVDDRLAALGFAEWVALNCAHRGIHVTCLCPNAVNTGMLGRNEDDPPA